MRYNLSQIMTRAWKNYRKNREDGMTFSEALHRAWLTAKAESLNAAIIEAAKADAGITEEVKTWSGWRDAGREVIHGSKHLFGCDLIYGSKGDGAVYKARFFGLSQTAEIPA